MLFSVIIYSDFFTYNMFFFNIQKNETGKNIGRAEMWKITHKRKNGTYVNDEAMEIGVTLFLLISKHHVFLFYYLL